MTCSRHNFCCCIPIRTGSFIIGYFITVYKTIMIFAAIIFLAVLKTVMDFHPDEVTGGMRVHMFASYGVGMLLTMQLVVSIGLIVGLHQMKLPHIEKFCRIYPILLGLLVFVVILRMAFSGDDYSLLEWYINVLDGLLLSFEAYGVIVVRRYYSELIAPKTSDDKVEVDVENQNGEKGATETAETGV